MREAGVTRGGATTGTPPGGVASGGGVADGGASSGIVSARSVSLSTNGNAGSNILDGHADDGAGDFTNISALTSITLNAGAGDVGTGAALLEVTNAGLNVTAVSSNLSSAANTTLAALNASGTVSVTAPGSIAKGNGISINVTAGGAAFAAAVESLLDAPERRIAMGAAARSAAEQRFSRTRMIKVYLDWYRELTAGGERISQAGSPPSPGRP